MMARASSTSFICPPGQHVWIGVRHSAHTNNGEGFECVLWDNPIGNPHGPLDDFKVFPDRFFTNEGWFLPHLPNPAAVQWTPPLWYTVDLLPFHPYGSPPPE